MKRGINIRDYSLSCIHCKQLYDLAEADRRRQRGAPVRCPACNGKVGK